LLNNQAKHVIFRNRKVNWKGIQVIIGLVIIAVMSISIFCNSSSFTGIWNHYFAKSNSNEANGKAGANNQDDKTPRVEFDSEIQPQKSMNWKSLSKQVRKVYENTFKFVINQQNLTYFILFWSTLLLVVVQILFIHDYLEVEFIQNMKKSKMVHQTCTIMEEYYMFEDLIYLPFSLLFLLILYIFLQSRRFNNYIMVKFKRYFKTQFFKVNSNALFLLFLVSQV
jgi:hypothetical protein